MDPINFDEIIKTASEAYALLKETGISETVKNGAIKFTSWFGSLFTRKLHKEKIALMEQLMADEKALKMLQSELETQVEENKALKLEIVQKQTEYNNLRKTPGYASISKIANSKLKNIVNAPISNVTGNIHIGDTNNK